MGIYKVVNKSIDYEPNLVSHCFILLERCEKLSVNPESDEYHLAYKEYHSVKAILQSKVFGRGGGVIGW
jgi:hypothetical protein